MFQKIQYSHDLVDEYGKLQYVFYLVDDRFAQSFQCPSRSRVHLLVNIVINYKIRQLNVAQNVAKFYLSTYPKYITSIHVPAILKELETDGHYIDVAYATHELNYCKRYLPCVRRQFKHIYGLKGSLND